MKQTAKSKPKGEGKEPTCKGHEAYVKFIEKAAVQFGRPVIPEKPFAGNTDISPKITLHPYAPPEGYRELLTELEALTKEEREQFGDADLEAVLRGDYNFGDKRLAELTYKRIRAFVKHCLSRRKERERTTAPEREKEYEHSPDYKLVKWFGTVYQFKTKNRASAVRLLLQAYEDPEKVGVHEREIAKDIDTSNKNFHLLHLFRERQNGKRGYHPAWGTMIVHRGHGVYQLKAPENITGH